MSDDEEEEMPMLVDAATMSKQIPVSIMTGFLGSGKTTLLNYLLRHQHGKRIAIIENEFSGGLGIENMIAKSGVNGDDMAGQCSCF
jgi:G3E family GTPase